MALPQTIVVCFLSLGNGVIAVIPVIIIRADGCIEIAVEGSKFEFDSAGTVGASSGTGRVDAQNVGTTVWFVKAGRDQRSWESEAAENMVLLEAGEAVGLVEVDSHGDDLAEHDGLAKISRGRERVTGSLLGFSWRNARSSS